jgi:hypothetical protein
VFVLTLVGEFGIGDVVLGAMRTGREMEFLILSQKLTVGSNVWPAFKVTNSLIIDILNQII